MSKPQRTEPEDTTALPTTIVFVRHGVTPTTGKVLPGREPGLHLSDVGQAQAKAVGRQIAALQDGDPDRLAALYASPMERTRETAAAIAEATGLEVVTDPGLLDIDTGDWTGMTLEDARKQPEWGVIQSYPSGFRFPGGESFPEMHARIVETTGRLRDRHPGQVVVAVSHADPIRAVTAHAMGTHPDLFQRLMVSPCSVTAIAFGRRGPMVLTVNSPDATPLVQRS